MRTNAPYAAAAIVVATYLSFAPAQADMHESKMSTSPAWGTASQEELYDRHMDMTRRANILCDDFAGAGGGWPTLDIPLTDELDPCVVNTLDSMVMQTGDTGIVLVHLSLPANVRYAEDRPELWRKRAMDGDLIKIRNAEPPETGMGMQ